jgi:hypothetical protein
VVAVGAGVEVAVELFSYNFLYQNRQINACESRYE